MDDTVLIEAARSGDLAAFSDLVRRHQALVRAALAVRMSCPHEAEDLAQEAFVTAFRKLEVFATGFFEAACVRTRASGQYRVVGGRIAEDRARADLQPPAIRKKETMRNWIMGVALFTVCGVAAAPAPKQISGIYPHLTMYNDEGECGTGAVVPWADRLWVITYGPHLPLGSSDKLYEITPELEQHIRPESVGGTPANRMIHLESQQLSIGPYLIDKDRNVRVLAPKAMPGRLTGTARHLTDPANKIHIATMEEGLYSVDVRTLAFEEHIKDGNGQPRAGNGIDSKLPGYHGKGLFSGQGFLVYANNGTRGKDATVRPDIPSGALGVWQGEGDWTLVRENQFTEVSGPGGITGNPNPDTDPVWSLGWDNRSLILMLLENRQWHAYRLPKGSHSYDGAHGWNTEWPRIREIGETDLLATMHGTFWRFPAAFSRKRSAGIAPRSNYLKVIGDFARWNDRVVFGCDDSAQKEFLNHRPFKSARGAPVQSNSNLWFVDPARLDRLGPAIGRGSVWLRDTLAAGQVSEPFLFDGYDYRMLTLSHANPEPVTFTLEVDRAGNGTWEKLRSFTVDRALVHLLTDAERGAWVRARVDVAVQAATVHFHYRNKDPRGPANAPIFDALAKAGETPRARGVIRSNRTVLSMLDDGRYYELNSRLELSAPETATGAALVAEGAQPESGIRLDDASLIVVEDGKTYRLPKNPAYTLPPAPAPQDTQRPTLEALLPRSLAKGAAATASSVHQTYQAAFAADGLFDDDSRWIGSGPDSWLALDLGAPKTFRSVFVATGWKREAVYAARDFDVQVKRGTVWQTLPGGEIRGNAATVVGVRLAEPVTAQEVRVLVKDAGYARVYEVALFADQPELRDTDTSRLAFARVCREVATERDLFNIHGTFYELPARNAQGFAKIRPVATHNLAIHDYASHFGMLVLTGLKDTQAGGHVLASADGRTALWAGVIDDLWQLGKPRGEGGVWNRTAVKADVPSDPYLMTGFDQKSVRLLSTADARITLEIDIDGTELWVPCQTFTLKAGDAQTYRFPEGFSAYWVRAVSSADTTATVMFTYE